MSRVRLDYSKSLSFFEQKELSDLQNSVDVVHNKMQSKLKAGHHSMGWVHYPVEYNLKEFERIQKSALKVKEDSHILLVIGIGGSYIGAHAAIRLLTHSFQNHLPKEQQAFPKVYFVGNNLSSTYMSDLIDLLHGKDFSINVISKSGTTLEPAIAFRIFRKLLLDKYGEKEAQSRIYVTTDQQNGSLKMMAQSEGYETFTIPDNIGGRFSVLTAVGLFPIAVSGICIEELMEGAQFASLELSRQSIAINPAYQYAAIRNILYSKGKTIEILASYEPSFHYFSEWWKQLFAESEGKDGKGIFPTSAIYSTDLHSIGQYIQEGRRDIFETIIKVEKVKRSVQIEKNLYDFDNLNYLNGRTVDYINEKAFEGTMDAHVDGGVPNLVLSVSEISPYSFGYLVYFFQMACAMSANLMGVNPFNQPGVEAYKRNMFLKLGCPNYEKIAADIK